MQKKNIVLAILIAQAISAAACQACLDTVKSVIRKNLYSEQNIGIFLKDITTDSLLVSLNHTTLFNPASVIKMLTALAATDMLGQNYLFKTKIYHDGFFSKDSGIVRGNLYIRGGGDPCLLVEKIWLLAQHLTYCGIREITKDLILDDSFFDTATVGPGYGQEKSSRAYEAPVSSLSANFNTIVVHVAPGAAVGSCVVVTPFPNMENYIVNSTATTAKSNLSSGLDVRTDFVDGKTTIAVSGTMGVDAEPKFIYRRINSPWQHFGQMLVTFLKQSGIVLHGRVVRRVTPDSLKTRKPFYIFTSGTLQDAIRNMFKFSSNFTAEMVFKTLSAEQDSGGGSWQRSANLVNAWWHNSGLDRISASLGDTTMPLIGNGSGMGDVNKLSCAHICALLVYAYNKKSITPDFQSALSVADVDGTLKSRFNNSRLQGIVRAKTGTIIDCGVSDLAGYIFLQRKVYLFAICINDMKHTYASHCALQEKILEAVFPEALK